MEQALTIDQLKGRMRAKYDYDERRIVGIILARYDISLVKNLISDCYQYWHLNTGRFFDVYWAGYGAYICPDDQTSTKVILDYSGNTNRVYFDLEAFIGIKDELTRVIDKNYKDHIELVLANYYDGQIHFNESVKIDLEENLDNNYTSIRQIFEWLTMECKEEHDVVSLIRKMKLTNLIESIKGIKLSEFIGHALSVAGMI